MNRRGSGVLCACFFWLLVLLLAAHGAAAAAPALGFGAQGLTGSGFSPGGQVVWFGSARLVAEDYYLTLAHFQSVTLADAGGAARYDLGKPLPPASVWVAVDLTTGAYALATPNGVPPRLADLPTLRTGSGATSDLVEDRRQLVAALLVRPGLGAWELTVGDGGPADEDGAGDGHLQFSLARMHPLVLATADASLAPPAPARLATQDLLLVLGTDRLEVSLLPAGVSR